jgi:2-dehydropantoate 2-reductase
MRITIVGAGAIGGFIAAALARAGTPTGVVARGEHLEAIRERGLRIASSDLGAFSANIQAARDVRELPRADVLVLTFKAHQWPDLLEPLKEVTRDGTPIVTLQNGVPFWFVSRPPLRSVDPAGRIAATFAESQVIGGVVHVSGHIVAPGVIVQSGGLRYLLGEVGRENGARIEELARTLYAAGLQAEVDGNLRRSIWYKLVGNASLNPMSVVTGMTIGQMMRDAAVLDRIRSLMYETLEVGRALGLVNDIEREAEHRITYAKRLDDVKSSMLQDAEAGRSLEIEPIVGAVIELADRVGIDVPQEREIYEQLRTSAGLIP